MCYFRSEADSFVCNLATFVCVCVCVAFPCFSFPSVWMSVCTCSCVVGVCVWVGGGGGACGGGRKEEKKIGHPLKQKACSQHRNRLLNFHWRACLHGNRLTLRQQQSHGRASLLLSWRIQRASYDIRDHSVTRSARSGHTHTHTHTRRIKHTHTHTHVGAGDAAGVRTRTHSQLHWVRGLMTRMLLSESVKRITGAIYRGDNTEHKVTSWPGNNIITSLGLLTGVTRPVCVCVCVCVESTVRTQEGSETQRLKVCFFTAQRVTWNDIHISTLHVSDRASPQLQPASARLAQTQEPQGACLFCASRHITSALFELVRQEWCRWVRVRSYVESRHRLLTHCESQRR